MPISLISMTNRPKKIKKSKKKNWREKYRVFTHVFHVKEINKSGVWSSLEPKVEEPCERNISGLGKPPSKDNSPDDGIVIKVGGVNARVSYLDIRM